MHPPRQQRLGRGREVSAGEPDPVLQVAITGRELVGGGRPHLRVGERLFHGYQGAERRVPPPPVGGGGTVRGLEPTCYTGRWLTPPRQIAASAKFASVARPGSTITVRVCGTCQLPATINCTGFDSTGSQYAYSPLRSVIRVI